MTEKELISIVQKVADQFTRCEDPNVRFRAGQATCLLLVACKCKATDINTIILPLIEDFYTCYYYGEGFDSVNKSISASEAKKSEHGEFLVKYCRKIAFGLCAEDERELRDYIDEIDAYKNEHSA